MSLMNMTGGTVNAMLVRYFRNALMIDDVYLLVEVVVRVLV